MLSVARFICLLGLKRGLKALSIFHFLGIIDAKGKTTSNYTAILDLQGDMCLA